MQSEAYFDKGEFADDVQRVVGNNDFAVVVNPTLTAKQVMNARCCFVPRIQLSRPSTVTSKTRVTIRQNSNAECNEDIQQ